jgi:hypothetical protein
MAEEFKNSRINGAFVAELHDFIYDNRIDYWIHLLAIPHLKIHKLINSLAFVVTCFAGQTHVKLFF